MADIDTMMNRIAALLAKAESTEFEEEAKSLRAKAEELMRKYRIEEEQLIRTAVSSGAPVWRSVDLVSYQGQWTSELQSVWYWIAEHCGVRYVTDLKKVNGEWVWVSDVVGYEIDLRLAEMMYYSARLAFYAKMEPEFDPSKTMEENVYWLRGSGMDRQRVAEKVFGQKGHAEGIKVGKIYRQECEKRGEADAISGRGFNANLYRQQYADGFRSTIRLRLRNARDAADATGGALVLPQRAERVAEALYVKYPTMRPETPEQAAERKARRDAERAAETPEERKAREARERKLARPRKWTQADEARYVRENSPRAERARAAGSAAARSVDLVRQAPAAPRASAAPERTALEG